MSAPTDESRLTAYVLGELSEAERSQVEAWLETSPEARQAVDEIRQVAGLLKRGLAQPAQEGLSDVQRAAIDAEAARPPRRRWPRVAAWGGGLAAAASLVFALLLGRSTQVPLRSSTQPAQSRPAVTPAAVTPDAAKQEIREIQTQLEALKKMTSERKSGLKPSERGLLARERALVEPAEQPTGERYVEMANELRDRSASLRASLGPASTRRDQSQLAKEAALEALKTYQRGQHRPEDALHDLRRQSGEFTTEAYDSVQDNPFVAVAQDPLSTFSIDVDTASYSNVRRFLRDGQLPPPGAVRIEELINSFDYDYAPPRGEHPFAVHLDAAACPWAPQHQLVRIGLKGKVIERGQRPPSNLVFLIDVSGSMQPENKLPLLKRALRLLVQALDERDRVAIVVYAGSTGLVLPSTSADQKGVLLEALQRLEAGGTTHGSAGLQLAYETAQRGFIKGGTNRVILATDGDFNVGVTNQSELVQLIEAKAKEGVFLTVLGVGMGNYKDSTLEKLADRGNGQYGYIDHLQEAQRLVVDQLAGTLVTIAKDVKIQVELNPSRVSAFRLIGYENRVMAHQDFADDRKDAGEIGAGHTVTALYEIVPVGAPAVATAPPALRYQKPRDLTSQAKGDELLTVRLRYKAPDGDKSTLIEEALKAGTRPFTEASGDFRFASAVAAFGMILRDSPHRGNATLDDVSQWARAALGRDPSGQRAELLALVRTAQTLRASQIAK